MDISYTGEYQIRSNEIDTSKKVKVSAFIQLMQEASLQNAIDLRVSYWDLNNEGLSWVLVKKSLNIIRYPALGETIKIKTYPSGFNRLFAFRDFIGYDSKGVVLAKSSTVWVLMNIHSRKAQTIDKERFKGLVQQDTTFLEQPPKIHEFGESVFNKDYEVNYFDLDWNGHANNGFIIRSIVEGVPDDYLVNKRIKHAVIQFKKECFWKDKISSTASADPSKPDTLYHKVLMAGTDEVIATANTTWHSI